MLDRNSFMETLRAVAELCRTSTEPLSKEEILKHFDDIELTEEQVEEESEEENIYFQMYLEDLEQIEEMSEDEMQAAYAKLLAGDASVIGSISESWLRTIAQLAIPFAAQGANLQDVIQEGNMGLLIKLSELVGVGEMPAMDDILEGAVSAAMIAYTEENMEGQVADMIVKEQEKNND